MASHECRAGTADDDSIVHAEVQLLKDGLMGCVTTGGNGRKATGKLHSSTQAFISMSRLSFLTLQPLEFRLLVQSL